MILPLSFCMRCCHPFRYAIAFVLDIDAIICWLASLSSSCIYNTEVGVICFTDSTESAARQRHSKRKQILQLLVPCTRENNRMLAQHSLCWGSGKNALRHILQSHVM